MEDAHIDGYERHPLSYAFPKDQKLIERLAASMREEGFDPTFPVIVYEGQVLDGFHRYSAAKLAGIEPIIKEFDGDEKEAVRFINRANSERRQLAKGAQAKAVLLYQEQIPQENRLSDTDICYRYGISPSALRTAREAIRLDPEGALKVASGELDDTTHNRDVGLDPPKPPVHRRLEATHARKVEAYYSVLTGNPSMGRKSIGAKTALNALIDVFVEARKSGRMVAAVPEECACGVEERQVTVT